MTTQNDAKADLIGGLLCLAVGLYMLLLPMFFVHWKYSGGEVFLLLLGCALLIVGGLMVSAWERAKKRLDHIDETRGGR